ncbi:MAG: ABC transporter ATP-binding protein [Parachlamydiaceae bacterium]|nr:ABC transporter ATP-binding protein [Parachlamydiaceae bacterium]
MSNQYAIDVHNLNKSFGGIRAVHDLSLSIGYGEIFGFLGPNGSGKTTSIRMMCGLLTPDSGEGTCLGYNILTESNQIKRHVGYMTQKFSMWEDLTVWENLNFVACMYGIKDRKQRIELTIEQLGLYDRSSQLVKELSGGWKQRMALAACMLHDPKLLLLDEPTAGVDPKARRDFWEQLYELASKGISILVSTHYMDEAERCHKVAYIFNGELMAQGSASEVIANQGISTFAIQGGNLIVLAEFLKDKRGVDQTLLFGNTLHVSGHNKALLEETLSSLRREDAKWQINSIETSLEDVFIHLMESRNRAAI